MKKSMLSKAWNVLKNTFDNKIVKFVLPKQKCDTCEVQFAKWKHNYLYYYACDNCVPRGCSCRLLKKSKRAAFLIQYDYKKDKGGKEFPCEDWDSI